MAKIKKGWFDFMFEGSEGTAENELENTSEETVDEINVSTSNTEVVDVGLIESIPMNIPQSGDGVFDQKFFEFFQSVIAENNIPGLDYFEYREALKKMNGLSDQAKFQMAFDNFKIADPNLTKETLLSSVDHYNKLLSGEESDFQAEMVQETEREVKARRDKATNLVTENQDIYQQIQNLNEKITHNQQEAIKLNNDAALAEVKIGQTAKNFIKTLANVQATLNTDKAKIVELVQESKTA